MAEVRVAGHSWAELDEQCEQFGTLVEHVIGGIIDRALARLTQPALTAAALSADDLAGIPDQWDAAVRQTLTPYVSATFESGALEVAYGAAQALPLGPGQGIPGVTSSASERYLAEAQNRMVGLGSDLWRQTRAALQAGQAAGETIDEIADRVRTAAGVTHARAQAVARTEIMKASNAGSYQQALMVMGPTEQKEWLATEDSRTREDHAVANAQRRPISQPFSVGGWDMQYPLDDTAPASEVVNCRCTLAYVFDDEAPPLQTCDCAGGFVAALAYAPVVPTHVTAQTCICPVSAVPAGEVGSPEFTDIEEQWVYDQFKGQGAISPAYGGAKIYKHLQAIKADLGLDEFAILKIVDKIYGAGGGKSSFSEKFDEWLDSKAGAKATGGLKRPAGTPEPVVTPATHVHVAEPEVVPTPAHAESTPEPLSPVGVQAVQTEFSKYMQQKSTSVGDGPGVYAAVQKTMSSQYLKAVLPEFTEQQVLDALGLLYPTAIETYAKHAATLAEKAGQEVNQLLPSGQLDAVTLSQKLGISAELDQLIDYENFTVPEMLYDAIQELRVVVPVIAKLGLTADDIFQIYNQDHPGNYTLMHGTYSDRLDELHEQEVAHAAHAPAHVAPEPQPEPTHVVTQPPPAGVDPLSIAHVPHVLSTDLYDKFKSIKAVTPGWGGSAIYKNLQAVKPLLTDPGYVGLNDAQLLKMLDRRFAELGKATGKTYFDEVNTYVQTPAGKKLLEKSATTATVAAPTAKSSPPVGAPDTGELGNIGHISDSEQQAIHGLFKAQGIYVSSTPASIFDAIQMLRTKYKFVGQYTDLQLVRVIDAQTALKLSLENQNLYEKKLVAWLKTPAGKAHATAPPETKAKAKSATVSGTTVAPLEQKLVGTAEEHARSGYTVISTTRAQSLQDDQAKWTTAQRAGLRRYTDTHYVEMNKYLRGQVDYISPEDLRGAQQAQLGMRPSTVPILLHRGAGTGSQIGVKNAKLSDIEALVGKTLTDKGFMSTSVGGRAAFTTHVVLEIECPVGTQMAYVDRVSVNKGENEMVLAAGTRYKIVSVKEEKTKAGTKQLVVRTRVVQ
jgi:hypothetical protein